jgi:hypothetical protein
MGEIISIGTRMCLSCSLLKSSSIREDRNTPQEGYPHHCGDPGLPPGIPVMHTIHDPKKTIVNPHNRVGIQSTSSITSRVQIALYRPLGRIQMPHRACPNLTSSSGYMGSVGDPSRASTLQETDRETIPSSHRHRQNHHRPPHSCVHSLAKLIARDKAVSTF